LGGHKDNKMTTDLFKTKKQQLADFIKSRGQVKTSDVIRWGSQNYSNRADRDARDLAEKGIIERMPEDKVDFYYPGIKEEVWIWKT
jgi:hypothetical protein